MSWGFQSWLGSWGSSWGDIPVEEHPELVPAGLRPEHRLTIARAGEVEVRGARLSLRFGDVSADGRALVDSRMPDVALCLPIVRCVLRPAPTIATGTALTGSRARRISLRSGVVYATASASSEIPTLRLQSRGGSADCIGKATVRISGARMPARATHADAEGFISLSEEAVMLLYLRMRKRRHNLLTCKQYGI